MLPAVLAALVLHASVSSAPPCPPPPVAQSAASAPKDEQRFALAMEEIGRMLKSRRWAAAKEKLLALIAEHPEAPYVIARRHEIEEDLVRCSFWMKNEPPKPDDVIAGDVQAYDKQKGTITLVYDAATIQRELARYEELQEEASKEKDKKRELTDEEAGALEFVRADKVWIHKMAFDGPHVVEFTISGHRSMGVMVCMNSQGGQLLAVHFSNCKPVCTVKASVSSSSVQLFHNGKKVGDEKRTSARYGWTALVNADGLDKLTLKGQIETSWVENRIDAAMQERMRLFKESYDLASELPLWLRAPSAEASAKKDDEPWAFPGADPKVIERLVNEAGEETKGPEDMLAKLRKLQSDVLADDARAYVLARLCTFFGRWKEALIEVEKVTAAQPEHYASHELRAEIQSQSVPASRSIELARALVAAFPGEAKAHVRLAELLLVHGENDAARTVLDEASAAGVKPAELENMRRALSLATQGPAWNRTFEYNSTHFRVISDISQELCFDASKELEQRLNKYNIQLRRLPRGENERFLVCLFSGEFTYKEYFAGLDGGNKPNGTAGLYTPVLKQLLIWNVPLRESMFSTIRHEGFHQYLDRLTHSAPRWLNEGLAEYFELSQFENGRWRDGVVNWGHVQTLTGKKHKQLVSVEELLYMSAGRFYSDAALHYAQAWSFVHFLQHTTPANQRLLDQCLDALIAGAGTIEAVDKVFGQLDLDQLDRDYRAYVETL